MIDKSKILKDNNFHYIYDRCIYVNRELKKIFSVIFIEINPVELIVDKINKKNESDNWEFYFYSNVSNAVKNEIINKSIDINH